MVVPGPRPKTPGSQSKKLKAALINRARRDLFTFAGLVLRNEETGKPLTMAAVHKEICNAIQRDKYAIFVACPEIGKTQFIIAYCLWILGRNPRRTIALISATAIRARKILVSIKRYIETSKILRQIFPNLRPGIEWSASKIRVAGAGERPTPSISTYGVGNNLMGDRINDVLVDDVDNSETVQTEIRRDNQFRYIEANVLNRLTGDCKYIQVTNAWHVKDVAHRLKERPIFKFYKIPVIVTPDVLRQWPNFPYKIGESIWPAQWPASRIRERRKLTPSEEAWRRAYFCEPSSDARSFFRERHFTKAREMGEGLIMPQHLGDLFHESGLRGPELREQLERYLGLAAAPPGWEPEFRIITGVDVATGVNNDLSALCTLMEYRDGQIIRPLYVEEGDWHVTELLERMDSINTAFGGIFVVESVGTQLITLDLMSEYTNLSIWPFPTRLRDKVMGFHAIAAAFAGESFVIPSKGGVALTQSLEDMISGFRNWNPKDHARDIAMAALFAFCGLQAFRLQSFRQRNGRTEIIYQEPESPAAS